MNRFAVLGLVILTLNLLFQNCSYPDFAAPSRAKRPIYGKASYYSTKFHGRKTANGEIFDKYKLTAAHRSLPFGTICKVTNRANDKNVTVRINDRGPFVKGRILDLSEAAARAIDGITQGIIDVKIEIIKMGN